MILRHIFSPPNNTRLAHLCGPMDAHLRTIEAALQVKIAHRHEQFKVDGPKAKAKRAWRCCRRCTRWRSGRSTATVQLMLAGDGDMQRRATARR